MMAFYMQNTVEGDQRAQEWQSSSSDFTSNPYSDPMSLVYNKIGSFTGLWDPLKPAYANEAARAVRRPRSKAALAPGLVAQQNQNDPYTPNPYGINQYNIGNYNKGVYAAANEGRRYLGGYADDYVSEARVPIPYGSDNVSMRYFATKGKTMPVYGRPVYREGAEVNYPGIARLSVDGIRSWQAFFQANGFKTGPSGTWTTFEIDAMRHFMTMANGVPGGGMTVEVLRQRVMADIESGALMAGELAPSLGSSNLNENAMDGTQGGGGGMEDQIPFTQTTVERETNSISPDQGLMVLMDYWQRRIGRAPTQEELSKWVKGVNASMRADPTVITTVVTTDPMAGTVDTTRTVDETEVDPQAMGLTASLEDTPEGEQSEYQTGRYMDALFQELGI